MVFQTLYKNVILPVQDFVYPPVCFTCDQLRNNRRSKICDDCWSSIRELDPTHPTWSEIKRRFEQEHLVAEMLSLYLFEKDCKLQELIHLLKYRAVKSVGVELGKKIGEAIRTHPAFAEADVDFFFTRHLRKRFNNFVRGETKLILARIF